MPYMVTFTINIPQMLVYIPYMDPMGYRSDIPGPVLLPDVTRVDSVGSSDGGPVSKHGPCAHFAVSVRQMTVNVTT